MNSEMNDMEQWMQQSAEMGDVPVKEADWQRMKQLLQPEKKRRFVFFWWLAGLLLVGAVLLFTWVNNTDKKQSTKNNIASNRNKNGNETQANELSAEKPSSTKSEDERTMQEEDINKTALLTPSTKEKEDQEKKTKKPGVKIKTRQQDRTNKKTSPTIEVNDIDLHPVHRQQPGINDTNETGNTNSTVITADTTQQQSIITTTVPSSQPVLQDKQDNIQPGTVTVNDKSANDSTILSPPADSSIVKKKKINKKTAWLLAAGYYTGKVPVHTNGVIAKITYSHSLKRFSINPTVAIHQFTPKEQQQYNGITKITQNPGTTFIMINTRTVNFYPAKGIVLAPAVSVGYNVNKLNLTIGASKGVVINGNNKTTSTIDTASFSTAPLPATIKVSSPYDANSFNGKQYTALDVGLRYDLGKKYHVGINYAKQVGSNKTEGIVDEKKKRAALFLFFGLKL